MNNFTFIFLFFLSYITVAQVGIGTTNPNASSMLDIDANDKGVLIPRMLIAERIVISSPAEGLLVYQTDDVEGFYYFDSTNWNRMLDNGRNEGVPTGAIFSFPTNVPPTGYLECDGSAISRTTYASLFALIGVMYGSGDGSTTFNLPDYRGRFLRGVDNGSGRDPNAASRLNRGDGTTGDNVGTLQDDIALSHQHTIDPPTFAALPVGNHTHNMAPRPLVSGVANQPSVHSHRAYYRNRTVSIPGGGPSTTIREVDSLGPSFQTTSTSIPNHNHNILIPSLVTFGGGGHSHIINIPTFNSDINLGGGTETRPKNINVLWCIKY